MSKLRKSLLIGFAAVVVSTLGIQASDILNGVDSNLVGMVYEGTGPCGAGAKQMNLGGKAICVDVYEASPNDSCPHNNTNSPLDTRENMEKFTCGAVSQPNAMPWRFITFTEAQQLCARSEKRLPTNEEWYKTVLGQADMTNCVIDSKNRQPELTGSAGCITPGGIHDMVGNVWEWIDEEVVDGYYGGRQLPEEGYVTLVDTAGVVVETGNRGADEFGNDYAWIDDRGVKVMLRGGFYGSGEDAGIFAQNMSVAPSFQTAGVGFRCVKDI